MHARLAPALAFPHQNPSPPPPPNPLAIIKTISKQYFPHILARNKFSNGGAGSRLVVGAFPHLSVRLGRWDAGKKRGGGRRKTCP